MSGIQLFLITGVIFISIYFITRVRHRVLDLLILGAMIICAFVFIIRPDITNALAHKVGVGRGADLVFYISILIFWFIILKLYARQRKLEQMITDLIRKDALENAIKNTGTKIETKNPDEERH